MSGMDVERYGSRSLGIAGTVLITSCLKVNLSQSKQGFLVGLIRRRTTGIYCPQVETH